MTAQTNPSEAQAPSNQVDTLLPGTKYSVGQWLWYEHKGTYERKVVKGLVNAVFYYGPDEPPRYNLQDKDCNVDTKEEDELFDDEDEAYTEFWDSELERAKRSLARANSDAREARNRIKTAQDVLASVTDLAATDKEASND